MSKPRVVAVVQARMGGTRLPGKVLMKVCGRTLLSHHIKRLEMVARLDAIVVAIPDTEANDVLAQACEKAGWTCYRGPEDDVLARYHGAAVEHRADIVVRTTADCPLIDPGILAGLVREFATGQYDYLSTLDKTFPHGIADAEVVRAETLYEANAKATEPFDREHVLEYVRRHQDRPYILGNLHNGEYETAPPHYQRILREARLTVDWPEDLLVVQAIMAFWADQTRFITTADILWLLHKVPDIMELNRARAVEHAQLLSGAFEPISEEGRAEVSDRIKAAMEEKH